MKELSIEEKDLLLKDLSARLPYGVICKWKNDGYSGGGKLIDICKVKTSKGYIYWDCYFEDENDDIPIEIVKPYLRPMSSMTEEEKKELSDITGGKFTYVYGILSNSYQNKDDGEWHNKCFRYVTLESIILVIDWLNAYHFDYRGLIDKGLALEAPEGMYNIKEK